MQDANISTMQAAGDIIREIVPTAKAGDDVVRTIVPKSSNSSLMQLAFVIWGIVGGIFALMTMPPILLAPTLWLGGLLFFGLGAIMTALSPDRAKS